jgi:hypothetical protein
MDTKERWTPGARHRTGALFSLPDPKLAPGTAKSGKIELEKPELFSRGPQRIFFWLNFPLLILVCSS